MEICVCDVPVSFSRSRSLMIAPKSTPLWAAVGLIGSMVKVIPWERGRGKKENCVILIETKYINEITWIGVPVALTSEKLKADNKITQWRGECTWLPYLFWPAQHLTSCKRRIYRYIWKNKTMERTFAWYLSREYYWHLLQVGSCVCYPKRKLLWSFPQSGSVI